MLYPLSYGGERQELSRKVSRTETANLGNMKRNLVKKYQKVALDSRENNKKAGKPLAVPALISLSGRGERI